MLPRIVTSTGALGIIPGMELHRQVAPRGLFVLFGLLVALVAANALAYAASTANWVPTSDNWFYLDRIVYPYAHGQFAIDELLVKRGAFDHSQPLRRLLLLANYEWFDVDFRVEAVFAALVGILDIALLWFCLRRELRAGMPVSGLAYAALAAVYFSLSAPVVFTWSLLTLGFTSQFVMLLWLLACWAVLERPSRGRAAILLACTFLFGLVADDTALVAVVAGAIAALILAWRGRTWKPAAYMVGACIVGIAGYLAFYHAVAPPTPGETLNGARALALPGSLGDAWQWGVVPLVSGLVHRSMLRAWFGDSTEAIVALIAAAFVLAHLWFWKRALTGTRNRSAFIAVVLMLLSYGLVAGIVLGRVSVYGVDYLWQPRYAIVYRWHLVALLVMLVAQVASWPVGGIGRRMAALSAASLLAVQVPIGIAAWNSAKYTRNANERMAAQVLELGQSGGARPARGCAQQLTVCKFDDARRQRIIGFLRSQRLSVFSEAVRERNGYPGD